MLLVCKEENEKFPQRFERVAKKKNWADVKGRSLSCESLVSFPTRVTTRVNELTAHLMADTRHVHMSFGTCVGRVAVSPSRCRCESSAILLSESRENVAPNCTLRSVSGYCTDADE